MAVTNERDGWNQMLVAFGSTGNARDERDFQEKFVAAVAAQVLTQVGLTGSQTIAGVKTFSSQPKFPVNTPVAGAGTIISDAAPLLTGITVITGANGTVGWLLPVTTGGDVVILKGTTAGVAKLWPQSGAQINAVGASTAMSLASGAIPVMLVSTSATQWYTLPLLPS